MLVASILLLNLHQYLSSTGILSIISIRCFLGDPGTEGRIKRKPNERDQSKPKFTRANERNLTTWWKPSVDWPQKCAPELCPWVTFPKCITVTSSLVKRIANFHAQSTTQLMLLYRVVKVFSIIRGEEASNMGYFCLGNSRLEVSSMLEGNICTTQKHSQSGFFGFSDAPWSVRSWIELYLLKKLKIRFRILSDLRIQSWIFLKKRTLRSGFSA